MNRNQIRTPPEVRDLKIHKKQIGQCKKMEEEKPKKQSKKFTADEILDILVTHGQSDKKFKWGENIKYSPAEIKKILENS